jgi:hypothetical protein
VRLAGRLLMMVLTLAVLAAAVFGCVRGAAWLRDGDLLGSLQRRPAQPVRLSTLDPYTRKVARTSWFGDYFTTMVFDQAAGSAAHPRIVARWERGTVSVGLLNDGGPGIRSYLARLLRRLDHLQRQVDFRLGGAHSPITVEFLDHATYVARNDSDSVGTTRTRYFVGPAGLARARISVDAGVQSTSPAIESTLIHELTHAIGASGHFANPAAQRKSVMYRANTLTAWSQDDAAVIRVLYSPFVRSGMTVAQARVGLRKYARAGR